MNEEESKSLSFLEMIEQNTKEQLEALEQPKGVIHTKVPVSKDNDVQSSVEHPNSVIVEAMDSIPDKLATTDTERKILEGILDGLSTEQIAIRVGIPGTIVRTYVRNPKVKAYLKEVKEAMNEIDQLMITSTLRKIVGDRIAELDDDESYSNLTRKDTLDVIRAFADISGQISKSQVSEKSDDVFVNIYQQILS